jgi:hypothetical protein
MCVTPLGSQAPALDREYGGVRAIVSPQFVHRRSQVRFHRALPDAQRTGNLLVGQSLSNEAQDRLFTVA